MLLSLGLQPLHFLQANIPESDLSIGENSTPSKRPCTDPSGVEEGTPSKPTAGTEQPDEVRMNRHSIQILKPL